MTERTESLRVRVTPDEKAQIEASAKSAGMGVSEWLRTAGVNQNTEPRSPKPNRGRLGVGYTQTGTVEDERTEHEQTRDFMVWELNHRMTFHGQSRDAAIKAVKAGKECSCQQE